MMRRRRPARAAVGQLGFHAAISPGYVADYAPRASASLVGQGQRRHAGGRRRPSMGFMLGFMADAC